jgi:beta-lactamase superfamily II metal-dependent hydrolase
MRTISVFSAICAVVGLSLVGYSQGRKTLDVYFIDVEGGQTTLLVAPSGESMLIDAGFPGPRDGDRIAAAAAGAGVKQIDYFLNTHLHADHFGAIPELAKKMPIRNFVDHGSLVETGERSIAAFKAYAVERDKGHHIVAKPGDKVPVKGLDVQVVIAGGEAITRPLEGGGAPNPLCRDWVPQEDDPTEDARSVGTVTRFGRFRLLDLGDLTWNKEHLLACPNNMIGTVDLYVTTRHGINGAGSPSLVHAIRPRVAVMNNAAKKGASREAWMTVKSSPGLEGLWQLHYSVRRPPSTAPGLHETAETGGPELNTSEQMIANLEEPEAHTPAYAIKLSAREDGSFVLTNSRNGYSKGYAARR